MTRNSSAASAAPHTASGRIEIVAAVPSSQIRIKLNFLKPFEAHNTAEFTLAANRTGPNPYLAKLKRLAER